MLIYMFIHSNGLGELKGRWRELGRKYLRDLPLSVQRASSIQSVKT